MSEWIPVTESLPETNDEVLVTYIKNGRRWKRYVYSACYWDNGDEEGHWESVWDEYRVPGTTIEILAWMPFPKPYREDQKLGMEPKEDT